MRCAPRGDDVALAEVLEARARAGGRARRARHDQRSHDLLALADLRRIERRRCRRGRARALRLRDEAAGVLGPLEVHVNVLAIDADPREAAVSLEQFGIARARHQYTIRMKGSRSTSASVSSSRSGRRPSVSGALRVSATLGE
jgi:hypothetical protein